MKSAFEAEPLVEAVRGHFAEHLGPPAEAREVGENPAFGSSKRLELLRFSPAGPTSPVVLATCGACLFEMKDNRRVELLTVLGRLPSEPLERVLPLLSFFAGYAEANDTTLRIGDVVRAPVELGSFSRMDSLLFLPPVSFAPSFHRLTVPRVANASVELIWLLPVYASEAAFALKHGTQALLMLLDAQGLDLTDPGRAEANPLLDSRETEGRPPLNAQESAVRPNTQFQKQQGSVGIESIGDTIRIRRGGARSAQQESAESSTPRIQRGDPAFFLSSSGATTSSSPAVRGSDDEGRAGPHRARAPETSSRPRPPAKRPASETSREVVRFDLSRGNAQREPPPKAVPIRSTREAESAETKAEAKRTRVEKLKAEAKEIEARAASRRAASENGGLLPADGASPSAPPPVRTLTAPAQDDARLRSPKAEPTHQAGRPEPDPKAPKR